MPLESDRLGRENQAASKLDAAKIRWILDDAGKFVAREVRRAKTYHVILVDPPKFGRGPEGEVWDLFTNLPAFLADCAKLLDPKQSSMILTVYAIRASALAFDQLHARHVERQGRPLPYRRTAIAHAAATRCPHHSSRAGPRPMTRAIKPITSLTNDRVKAIRALDMRKNARKPGFYRRRCLHPDDGPRGRLPPRNAGLSSGRARNRHTEKRLVNATLDEGAEVLEVSSAVLEKLAAKENPQTMLGVFKQRFVAGSPIQKRSRRNRSGYVLEEIRDTPAISEPSSAPPTR